MLSSLPLFQYSSILSPIAIKQQIVQEIKKFLWQGGIKNSKRFYLVNWFIVREPKAHGGLGIKDLVLVNLEMGAKLLWIMVTRKYYCWRKFFFKKYFTSTRKRCLDSTPSSREGSPIWKLIKYYIPIIQHKLSWVPKNGKKIDMWNDRIMGNQPLLQLQELF
jgi:hypothetical protein